MTNLYNKGKYRGGEWAKHLRPFLKTVGNRRWRRTANGLKALPMEETEEIRLKIKTRSKKTIEVKFKLKEWGNKTHSYKKKYRSLRAAKDAIKRSGVIQATIIHPQQ
jgi:hypothetical protein